MYSINPSIKLIKNWAILILSPTILDKFSLISNFRVRFFLVSDVFSKVEFNISLRKSGRFIIDFFIICVLSSSL